MNKSKSKPASYKPLSKKFGVKSGLANGKATEVEEEVAPEEVPPTIITVLYGQSQRAIINTSCKSRALLEHIKRKCKCSKSVTLDLIDMDGQMKNLYKSKSRDYSRTEDVLSRGEYILVKVEELSHLGPTRYTPLLHNMSQLYPEIHERLAEMMAESEAKSAVLKAEEMTRMKENAEAGWTRIRSTVKNSERAKGVISAITDRRKSRSSVGRGSQDRRKSVDFKKQNEGKKKKSRSG